MWETHSAHANLFGHCALLVNIDFEELNTRMDLGKLLEDGGDNTAWATPSCPEVEDGHGVLIDLQEQIRCNPHDLLLTIPRCGTRR